MMENRESEIYERQTGEIIVKYLEKYLMSDNIVGYEI